MRAFIGVCGAAVLLTFACSSTRTAPTPGPTSHTDGPSPSNPTPSPTQSCTRQSCSAINRVCGTVDDGCGGLLDCGRCPSGQHCGGSGQCVGNSDNCTPRSCADVGASCGEISDGCGGVLACGDCGSGKTCGGSGVANQCGGSSCQVTSCSALGRACGVVSDGCAGTLDCGSCGANQRCSAAGQCEAIPSDCVKRTCAELGKNCGTVSDGCGGTMNCGTCEAEHACSDVNVCVGVAQAGGSTEWVVTGSPAPAHTMLDSDSAGELYLATLGSTGQGRITRYSSSGAEAWHVDTANHLDAIHAQPSATSVVVSGERDFQGNCSVECSYGAIESYGKDGTGPSSVQTVPNGVSAFLHAYANDGSMLVSTGSTGGPSFNASVQGVKWTADIGQMPIVSAVFDGADDVIVAGSLSTQVTYKGVTFGVPNRRTGVVAKFSPTGALLWGHTFAADNEASVMAVRTTAAGTVVVLGAFSGTLTVAGVSYTSPTERGFLAVLEGANGQERFARAPLGDDNSEFRLAVDPMGRAFVAYDRHCSELVVLKYDLSGLLEWRRSIPLSACTSAPHEVSALAVSEHGVVVAGQFAGTVDFGKGPVTANGDSSFLLKLTP